MGWGGVGCEAVGRAGCDQQVSDVTADSFTGKLQGLTSPATQDACVVFYRPPQTLDQTPLLNAIVQLTLDSGDTTPPLTSSVPLQALLVKCHWRAHSPGSRRAVQQSTANRLLGFYSSQYISLSRLYVSGPLCMRWHSAAPWKKLSSILMTLVLAQD